jgi:hypothetical protein
MTTRPIIFPPAEADAMLKGLEIYHFETRQRKLAVSSPPLEAAGRF